MNNRTSIYSGELLTGQVAVVTGAASGIGVSVTQALLDHGATVVMLDINEQGMQSVISRYNERAEAYVADITDAAFIEGLIKKVASRFGRIDILVNCAGITGDTNIVSHLVNTDNLKRVFDVNFMSSFYMAKAVLPFMLERNYGRILHIASIAGKEGNAGMLAYSASKAAVIGMTKVQGKEYAQTGITVNAVAPAVIRTPMVEAMPEQQVKYMTDKIPMQRCGTLEEIAALVLYIVSPASSFITGFTFDLSGGRATY